MLEFDESGRHDEEGAGGTSPVLADSPPGDTGKNQTLGSIGLRSQRPATMGLTSADFPKAHNVKALARSINE